MKVMCINSDFFKEVPNVSSSEEKRISIPPIQIGEVCTVIDTSEYSGITFYRFKEYIDVSGELLWWYDANSFIPLQDDTNEIKETLPENQKIK